MRDETGVSLLEMLVVLAILGLIAMLPFLVRGAERPRTVAEIEQFVVDAIAETIASGQDKMLTAGSQQLAFENRIITWPREIGVVSDEAEIVLFRNGTSSTQLTMTTPSGPVGLLSVPNW